MTQNEAFDFARESAAVAKDQAGSVLLAKGQYLLNLVDTLRGRQVSECVIEVAVEIYMAHMSF